MKLHKIIFKDNSFLLFSNKHLPENSGGIAKDIINITIEFKREQNITLAYALNTVLSNSINNILSIICIK